MRAGRIWGVPIRLNPLAIPMIFLAVWLGSGRELAVLAASVMLHEWGHILAARLLHVRVLEMELMPIGGAARLENVWQLRPGQLIGVALAGPAVNLLIVLCCAAWPYARESALAALIMRLNLSVLAFNLLPALPLDGGRIVCGLLGKRMQPVAAARFGIRLGILAACLILGVAAYGSIHGRLNLTLILAAIFMMMTASTELRQAGGAAVESLMDRREELRQEEILPVRVMACTSETPLRSALSVMRSRQVHVFVCLDEHMRLSRAFTETELLEALLSEDTESVGDLLAAQAVSAHSPKGRSQFAR